jgi:hypothetical protein
MCNSFFSAPSALNMSLYDIVFSEPQANARVDIHVKPSANLFHRQLYSHRKIVKLIQNFCSASMRVDGRNESEIFRLNAGFADASRGSAFCPDSAFSCFVCVSKHTANTSRNNFNRFACVVETKWGRNTIFKYHLYLGWSTSNYWEAALYLTTYSHLIIRDKVCLKHFSKYTYVMSTVIERHPPYWYCL